MQYRNFPARRSVPINSILRYGVGLALERPLLSNDFLRLKRRGERRLCGYESGHPGKPASFLIWPAYLSDYTRASERKSRLIDHPAKCPNVPSNKKISGQSIPPNHQRTQSYQPIPLQSIQPMLTIKKTI